MAIDNSQQPVLTLLARSKMHEQYPFQMGNVTPTTAENESLYEIELRLDLEHGKCGVPFRCHNSQVHSDRSCIC